MKVSFYYDGKFNDILVVPDLSLIGVEADIPGVITGNIPLSGYRIGTNHIDASIPGTVTSTVNATSATTLPACKALVSTTTLMIGLPGFDRSSPYNGVEDNRTGPLNVTRGKYLPAQYVSLGSLDDITVDPGYKASTFRVIQTGVNTGMLLYAGKVNAAKVLIPLNF